MTAKPGEIQCPECGHVNPPWTLFCEQCKRVELSRVKREPSGHTIPKKIDEPKVTGLILETIPAPKRRFILMDGQTVGRDMGADSVADVVLAGVPHADAISRRHATFTCRRNQWYVQHVGKTNFIVVDGETYEASELVALRAGSLLVLGETAFRVLIHEGDVAPTKEA